MDNKFSEGQQVIYQREVCTVTDCWQGVSGGWLYNLERKEMLFGNIPEAQLSELPADQALKASGAAMLPGMEGE